MLIPVMISPINRKDAPVSRRSVLLSVGLVGLYHLYSRFLAPSTLEGHLGQRMGAFSERRGVKGREEEKSHSFLILFLLLASVLFLSPQDAAAHATWFRPYCLPQHDLGWCLSCLKTPSVILT